MWSNFQLNSNECTTLLNEQRVLFDFFLNLNVEYEENSEFLLIDTNEDEQVLILSY